MPKLAWLAEVIFFGCYAIAYFLNVSVPHNGWTLFSAIAAAVIALLLLLENYETVRRPGPQA